MDKPVVGVVMGSQSDWDVMQHAAKVLKDFGVPFEAKVVSAHRTPDAMFEYAETARGRGLRCIVAGAGGAPGALAGGGCGDDGGSHRDHINCHSESGGRARHRSGPPQG